MLLCLKQFVCDVYKQLKTYTQVVTKAPERVALKAHHDWFWGDSAGAAQQRKAMFLYLTKNPGVTRQIWPNGWRKPDESTRWN